MFNSKKVPIVKQGIIIKIGEGEIGGKARGIPFLDAIIEEEKLANKYLPHKIMVPKTWVLATGIFDTFIQENELDFCLDIKNNEKIKKYFREAFFNDEIIEILYEYLNEHKLPIAIRSSATSEDACNHPAAGLYQTIMIPNNNENILKRLQQLCEAIKLVYASTFSIEAAEYLSIHNIPREQEKMAVILEEVVGNKYNSLYYPFIAGVAQSVNFFPVGSMQQEDGATTIAIGLGRKVVSGHTGMRFCPKYPTIRPQFCNQKDILHGVQDTFDAVNLSPNYLSILENDEQTITSINIENINENLSRYVISYYDQESKITNDYACFNLGIPVLTFNKILKQEIFPLSNMLIDLLKIAENSFASPVELEFAVSFPNDDEYKYFNLYILQARRMPALEQSAKIEFPFINQTNLILSTEKAMGHGKKENISYIIFVDPFEFNSEMSAATASEIAFINQKLYELKENCILIGPGRWGSCNSAVGIPVSYTQVSTASVIAELSTQEIHTEPSQGSHFFHNVVSGGIFYFTVDNTENGIINLSWLRQQQNTSSTTWAKLIKVNKSINAYIDSKRKIAKVFLNNN